MQIDEKVNWELARFNLQQVAEQVMLALRLCDIAELATDPAGWSDDELRIEDFISVAEMSDGQIEELSARYKKIAATIVALSKALNGSELNDECEEAARDVS